MNFVYGIGMNFVYEIPKNTDIIVVADFFSNQVIGGAELTLAAILEDCPYKCFSINSEFVTPDLIEKNKDKHWLISNCAKLSKESIISFVVDKIKYDKIECDYYYCQYRSSHLHKIQTGKECDCQQTQYGKLVYGFYKNAQHVFFMSHGQLNEYKRLFPTMNNWKSLLVQGSTFDNSSIKLIEDLNSKTMDQRINDCIVKITDVEMIEKLINYKDKRNKYVVFSGGSWIKAQQETEKYCINNNISYELVGGGLPHHIFLIFLSQFKGLVFRPAGFDTNPRIVIESKALGLDLILGENVQTKDEEWLKKSPSDLVHYLKTQKNFIWEIIKI